MKNFIKKHIVEPSFVQRERMIRSAETGACVVEAYRHFGYALLCAVGNKIKRGIL